MTLGFSQWALFTWMKNRWALVNIWCDARLNVLGLFGKGYGGDSVDRENAL